MWSQRQDLFTCQILKNQIKSFLYENLKTPVYRTRLVMTNYWSLACNVGKDVRLENYGQIINESHIYIKLIL